MCSTLYVDAGVQLRHQVPFKDDETGEDLEQREDDKPVDSGCSPPARTHERT